MPYSIRKLLSFVRENLGRGRRFLRVRDVIDQPEPPAGAVLLRFDVERALPHHLDVARQLHAAGICGTFYFHTRRGCYDPIVLKAIGDLGHEVGYHHECLDRCGGDFDRARELFLKEVQLFRGDGLELMTVCGHGEAGLPKVNYRSSWDIFERFPTLIGDAGLRGEVYLWLHRCEPLYASDTFRSYRRFWDTLDQACATPDRPIMVLVHLHRWRRNPVTMSLEVGRDLLRQIRNRVCRKRGYKLAYS